ncbi:response regulator [Kribbella pittospori]|uniref:response regulator n=1 Tax=Kribbella pittospori TaxID=722689 RepID=UPI001EDCB44E|nr:response regulator transcription factor [Kribbella pittospori]
MIRILLADDHTLVRRGVRLILDSEPDLQVVAEASDGAEAVEAFRRTTIELAVLDVAMPRMTGLQAARELSCRRGAAADADVVDVRQRAVLLCGVEGRRLRLRAEVGRRPRPGRRLPRGRSR